MAPRDIAPWTHPELLSEAIRDTSYERESISGMLEKLILVWLYYTPDAPESSLLAPPSSASRKLQQDTKGKKRGKPTIKSEPSEESDLFVKPEPSKSTMPKLPKKGKAAKSANKRQRPRGYHFTPTGPGVFDQTGLDQTDPSDHVSSPIIEATIGPQELDDRSGSNDSDNEVENYVYDKTYRYHNSSTSQRARGSFRELRLE
ncbi:hypothetical protein MMC07_005485 [Pseudocyphellaria aurata]|nr:hypothetical protein [Pseudocyphellaria aurata]